MITARCLLAFALVALFALPAVAQSRPPRACAVEIGRAPAQALVRDCREASPSAPALCRPETACETMREMIAEGCGNPGMQDKPVCRDLDTDDEDDDDDE